MTWILPPHLINTAPSAAKPFHIQKPYVFLTETTLRQLNLEHADLEQINALSMYFWLLSLQELDSSPSIVVNNLCSLRLSMLRHPHHICVAQFKRVTHESMSKCNPLPEKLGYTYSVPTVKYSLCFHLLITFINTVSK